MGRKPKTSYEEKLQAVKDYLNGKDSTINIARRLNLGKNGNKEIYYWIKKYQNNGPKSLLPKPRNSTYTKEFKLKVVEEYLKGKGSLKQLCIEYKIPSDSTLRTWISKYNNLKELKDYKPKPEVYTKMAYRKKTTLEERKEIVNYCIENNKDYKGTATLYDVSYSQVYKWVNDYLSNGEEILIDNRGKRKSEDELTELEKAERKIKNLEAKVKELEMEQVLLKKVEEIERRRYFQKPKTK